MSLQPVVESLAQPETRAAWLRLLDRPGSRVEYHPDLVMAATPAGATAMVYAEAGKDNGRPEVQALAALIPKRVRVVRASYIDQLLSLSGYRLVADSVLGADSGSGLSRFLEEAIELLDSGKADCLYFDDLEVDSPMWQALHELEREHRLLVYLPSATQAHWWIRFPEVPADYWTQF